jgi:2-deoxy-D-gluconate 3-dehydrogenase
MSNQSRSLEDKIAIVTGSKKGIGKAIALAMAQAGADVAICSREIEDGRLKAVADEIQGLGRRSLAVQADITRKTDVDNLVQQVIDKFGRIDVLVNNAGILILAPLLELEEDDLDKTIDTHIKGYLYCCQAVGKKMVEQKSGNIINLVSGLAWKALPSHGAYCAAKAGVIMLTRVLALELGRSNIRVNALCPGLVKTDMTDYMWSNPDLIKQMEATTALGRLGEPGDLGGPAVFLASDASNYITGHTVLADGGIYLCP